MPRGIPNARRDENAMRYTSFHVPLPLNPKHSGTHYYKSESQTLWYRNAARAAVASRGRAITEDVVSEGRRGSKTLVIHPGSRFLRVGRASDVTPVTVPNVIARKEKPPVPEPTYVEGISRPRKDKARVQSSALPPNGDEYSVALNSDDPFDMKVAAITISLRDRMRFYKLRVTQNAATIASTFNEQFVPEVIAEDNDPFQIDWIDEATEDYFVGEDAFRLADPHNMGYAVRWPVHGGRFNTRDYPSNEMILNDVETILRATLKNMLGIERRSYREYSVVLVIPDFYDRFYVEYFVRMLLVTMGFKQLCVQQESLAATYGAGISNACVVDMGATKTSIACVDDGMVIPDTRMSLNMSGDDITEFLYVLLERISFPYRDVNLARSYDWHVLEDLKARLCTLAEGDVALNLYDFVVRRPNKPTEKYGLRAYDEIILAPMCLFEPRVIEFDNKRLGMRPFSNPDVSEDIIESISDRWNPDRWTQAMVISTQHLLPTAVPITMPVDVQSIPPSGPQTPGIGVQPAFIVMPQPTPAGPSVEPTDAGSTPKTAPDTPVGGASTTPVPSDSTQAQPEVKEEASTTADTTPTPGPASTAGTTPVPGSARTVGEGTVDMPMEIIDVEDSKSTIPSTPAGAPLVAPTPVPVQAVYPGGYPIDVCFEASKLPLDVAIFNSARAAGGDEKIKKYLQAVLVIGGTALVPGMAHALESRLQAIATPLVPNMEKVQIIPPPKDVDPRVLAWKGAAVLARMDGVSDLWITPTDWDILGMRGLKERCFYL
ncbi:actin-like ATPase domain-containing protein [Laetiporus sulphureus 93-53]|uniref:Actin-like ATPase domain-containing protein n=1 Tax=Laetiporus sulphureus 93-53 TaxID=1314785 RepID=A0A165GD30_9APHY|nr:actin-like ATPase domain-containing protein [Laetiporus sulphureus 93-53]KZT10183.1 actin-like ATPase domain-containing protein [Laetiporus sulphureus 93-53]